MNPQNNAEIHYWEIDDNMQSKGLLPDLQEEYLNEEPKKAQIAFYSSALAVLLFLALSIMSWVLFHQKWD